MRESLSQYGRRVKALPELIYFRRAGWGLRRPPVESGGYGREALTVQAMSPPARRPSYHVSIGQTFTTYCAIVTDACNLWPLTSAALWHYVVLAGK